MIIVGLTGGIGSGKTTVAKIFETLGIPVYYADKSAKRIMNEDENLRTQVIALFGREAYSDGLLNKAHIGAIAFNDPAKLQQLNAAVHPLTIADSERWLKSQTTPYTIKEAALFFESGSNKQLDYIIGVSSPARLRINRVMLRDGLSEQEVERRMLNQMPEEEKMKLCDFVIVNDESQLIIPQVLELHTHLLELSRSTSGKIQKN